MTISEEIEVLSRVSQGGAAWLVATSARTLRGSGAPRNADGSYNGRELLRWRLDHLSEAEIAAAVNRLNEKQIIAVADAVCERLTRLLK